MINISDLEKINAVTNAVSDKAISAIKSMIKATIESQIRNELSERYEESGAKLQEDPMDEFLKAMSSLDEVTPLRDSPLNECVEPPKQNVSTLKKRIKHCKNPLEKKKLEQELNVLYKELKRSRGKK